MIQIYKTTPTGLEPAQQISDGCWINVISPTAQEIEVLKNLGVAQDFITYPLDADEQARFEKEDDGTILIVLRVPFFQGHQVDVPYTTLPIGIIMHRKYIFTICQRPFESLQNFITTQPRDFSTQKQHRFLLFLLLRIANRYLSYLREINKTIDLLEDQLQKSMRNREIIELLKYQKSLVYFTTGLKSNEILLERLRRHQFFKKYPDDEDLLEDVIIENQEAIEISNISTNILSGMMDAFASIISNNLNRVMKFLASITIVLSIPTIVASLYGMNVPLPFSDQPFAFLLVLAISFVLSIGVVLVFIKKDWF